ncbi:MAG: hypothetical protein JWQ26_2389 [Modestobacter sp.]|nr:hypothetical protein [Modestobacter sp.]
MSVEPLDGGAEQVADKVDLIVTGSRPRAAVRVATGPADMALRGRPGRAEVTGASGAVLVEDCAETGPALGKRR